MTNKQECAAILLMAGKGERFQSDIPKQFIRLSGKRIYLHTLEALLHSALFEEILLVCPAEWVEKVQEEIKGYHGAMLKVVVGGQTRQSSSYQGLLHLSEKIRTVLIHDAVRPFVSQKILKENLEKASFTGAVNTCIPTADTIVQTKDSTQVFHIPPREELLRGQTPQTFAVPLIKKAHEYALSCQLTATCDCSLVSHLNLPINIVTGDEANIKITSELDLFLAEQILRKKTTQLPQEERHPLKEKRFIVTGSSGTIGSYIVQQLIAEGAQVFGLSRSSCALDLTDKKAAKLAFDAIGPIDGLINCVGHLLHKPFEEHAIEEIDQLVDINLKSILYACQLAHVKPGGHIINFASSSYLQGRGNMATYSATKAAIVNFTQGLAEERGDLLINVIAPKRTASTLRLKHFGKEEEGELLQPSDIAQATLQLLKTRSVTGQVIRL